MFNALESLKLDNDLANAVNNLNARVESLEFIFQNSLVVFSLFAAFLGILGWKAITSSVESEIRREVKRKFDLVDPRNTKLFIPNKNFEVEFSKLRSFGFKNIVVYNRCGDIGDKGCLIWDGREDTNLNHLLSFMSNRGPKIQQLGIIVYTKSNIQNEKIDEYSNVTFANKPLTLPQAVLNFSRIEESF